MKYFFKITIIIILLYTNIIHLYTYDKELKFTKEEQKWLDQHPVIRVGIIDSWPPMDYVDEYNMPRGIGVDFVNLINNKLDNRLKIIPGPWHVIYEQCKNKELDALMDITEQEDRKPYFNFTHAYVHIPHLIIALKNGPYYNSIEDLKGKTIAAEKKYGIVKYVKNNYPSIKIMEYSSTNDALDSVSKGEADAYIGNRAVATYIIEKELISNLQFQAKITATSSKNSIGIRKDWPMLAAILDKVLASIPEEEKFAVYRKWGGMKEEEKKETQKDKLNLTDKELKWLKKHKKIIIAFDGDYAPYSYKTDENDFQGIAVDFSKELGERTGINFVHYHDGKWKNLYDAALRKKVDVIATLVRRPEREEYFIFTEPYISIAFYVITRQDYTKIKKREDIKTKKLALVKQYSTTSDILKEYPDITPYYVDSISETLEAVSSGKADAAIAGMGMSQHLIAKKGFQNLKFTTLYSQGLSEECFGVRKDQPLLASILGKALNSINEEKRLEIYSKWSRIEVAKIETILKSQDKKTPEIKLTEKEIEWVKQHPKIKVAADPLWPPVEFIGGDGEYTGISRDFLDIMENIIGIRFEMIKGLNWAESVEKIKDREIDMFSAVTRTPEREKYVNFSKPYINLFNVIFTQEKTSYIPDISDLNNKKTAVVRGYAVSEFIKKDYPDIILVEVENVTEGLDLLNTGMVYAYIDTLLTTSYFIQKEGYADIKVSGNTPYNYKICFASRNDCPELHSLLEKSLNAIGEAKRNIIFSKWRSIKIDKGFDYSLLWKIMPPALILLLFLILWLIKLRHEINKRKHAEMELVAAKESAETANKTKSLFLANMSHEIRTPMNAILGYSQILQQDKNLTDEQKSNVISINKSGEHLLDLINDILDMSKIEAGKIKIDPVSFNLHNLINDLYEMFRLKIQDKKIIFNINMKQNLPKIIYTDENRVRQILINLINNAVKFTEKGHVTLTAELITKKIVIRIDDTGKGISPDKLEIIFGAFEQENPGITDTKGTGLGLSISRKLAQLMNGDISVKSKLNKGSSFTFFFQYSPGKKDQIIKKKHNNKFIKLKDKYKGTKILIADDKKDNRQVACKLLKPFGFSIKEAEDGSQAVKIAAEWNPKIILMDVIMPKINGKDATYMIKSSKKGKDIIIIAVSASVIDTSRKDILDSGADSFINKPFKLDELLEEIGRLAGLEYIYENKKGINKNKKGKYFDISILSDNIIKSFYKAALIGDIDKLIFLISDVKKKDKSFADYLKDLINNFELEKIKNIFKKK